MCCMSLSLPPSLLPSLPPSLSPFLPFTMPGLEPRASHTTKALSCIPAQPVSLSVTSKMEDIVNEAQKRPAEGWVKIIHVSEMCQGQPKDSKPPSLSLE